MPPRVLHAPQLWAGKIIGLNTSVPFRPLNCMRKYTALGTAVSKSYKKHLNNRSLLTSGWKKKQKKKEKNQKDKIEIEPSGTPLHFLTAAAELLKRTAQ